MTRERFQTLAEAHGGDLARWPQDARVAAQSLLAEDAAWAEQALAAAARMDAILAQSRVAAPAADLVGRIIAAAPGARRRIGWLLPTGLGAGLAAACAAGLVVGVQLSRSAIEDQATTTYLAEDTLGLDLDEAA